MTTKTYNHRILFKNYLDRSNIVELYKHLGGSEPITLSNGQVSAHAFWRGDKKRSLSLTADQDRAYDFAEAKGYNSYSLAVEVLGSKDEAYQAMCKVAGLNLEDFKRNSGLELNKNINPINVIAGNMESGNTGNMEIPNFYPLSEFKKLFNISTLQ